MKIAIPVKDESLTFFGNAGHTPKFAIFEMAGSGMFRSFKLSEVRQNPRTDLDEHEHDEEEDGHHECSHGHDDAEHIAQHNKMGDVLEDCNYIVVKRACKNTVNAMKSYGVNVVKYSGEDMKSEAILRALATKFA
jgi:predicted Fe-Mo cluster-binding NifX family protein